MMTAEFTHGPQNSPSAWQFTPQGERIMAQIALIIHIAIVVDPDRVVHMRRPAGRLMSARPTA
jgi:hypothetical protein